MKVGARLSLGFAAVLVITIIGGVIASVTASKLSKQTEKLYMHPLAVGNAIRDIEISLVAIHRDMKDVAMARSLEALDGAFAEANEENASVAPHFDILAERFLGDPTWVSEARQLFEDWDAIRARVVDERRLQLTNDALALSRAKEVPHAAGIITALDGLADFAQGKAGEFAAAAKDNEAAQSGLVEKFHRYPFTVSTAVLRIQRNTSDILRKMKELAVAPDAEAIAALQQQIDAQAAGTEKEFALIKERFLGDQADILKAESLFQAWAPIRKEVADTRLAAVSADPGRITREVGAPHLALIVGSLARLKKFADEKGDSFYQGSSTAASNSITLLIAVFAAAVVIGALVAWGITRSITAPVARVTRQAEAFAEGKLNSSESVEGSDELASLGKAMAVATDGIRDALGEDHVDWQTVGAERRAAQAASDNLKRILGVVASNTDRLKQAAGGMNYLSVSMSAAAEETSVQSGEVRGAAVEAAGSIQSVAASTEELTASIKEIAHNANTALEMAMEAHRRGDDRDGSVGDLGRIGAQGHRAHQ
jgi:methyl-accepting chemotaxis protein